MSEDLVRYVCADCGEEAAVDVLALLDLSVWPPRRKLCCPRCLGRLIRREGPDHET